MTSWMTAVYESHNLSETMCTNYGNRKNFKSLWLFKASPYLFNDVEFNNENRFFFFLASRVLRIYFIFPLYVFRNKFRTSRGREWMLVLRKGEINCKLIVICIKVFIELAKRVLTRRLEFVCMSISVCCISHDNI